MGFLGGIEQFLHFCVPVIDQGAKEYITKLCQILILNLFYPRHFFFVKSRITEI